MPFYRQVGSLAYRYLGECAGCYFLGRAGMPFLSVLVQ